MIWRFFTVFWKDSESENLKIENPKIEKFSHLDFFGTSQKASPKAGGAP
jgi:hypothetical protein